MALIKWLVSTEDAISKTGRDSECTDLLHFPTAVIRTSADGFLNEYELPVDVKAMSHTMEANIVLC